MLIAHLSDVHVGDSEFDEALLTTAINEINAATVDLVVVAGDITAGGDREEFELARRHFERLACSDVICVPGNSDAQNAGYLHFEDVFGGRAPCRTLTAGGATVTVVGIDSSEPDVEEGLVGGNAYRRIVQDFERPADLRIAVIHHHLVAVPGTGRDRDVLADAGDVLEILRTVGVDLVLSGHRHVPHVWPVAGLFIIHSGTVATRRIRGYASPSYNLVTLDRHQLEIVCCEPAGGHERLGSYQLPYGPRGYRRSIELTKLTDATGV